MNDFLQITFTSTANKDRAIRVPKPDRGLANSDLIAAANKIVTANVFTVDGGTLNGVKRIDLLYVDRNILF